MESDAAAGKKRSRKQDRGKKDKRAKKESKRKGGDDTAEEESGPHVILQVHAAARGVRQIRLTELRLADLDELLDQDANR